VNNYLYSGVSRYYFEVAAKLHASREEYYNSKHVNNLNFLPWLSIAKYITILYVM
jgi:hypothetical protein